MAALDAENTNTRRCPEQIAVRRTIDSTAVIRSATMASEALDPVPSIPTQEAGGVAGSQDSKIRWFSASSPRGDELASHPANITSAMITTIPAMSTLALLPQRHLRLETKLVIYRSFLCELDLRFR